MEKRAWF